MAFFFSWGLARAEPVLDGCMAGDGAGFKCVNRDANQNIKLNKNKKYAKLMYEVIVMCSWHLCSDKLCFL